MLSHCSKISKFWIDLFLEPVQSDLHRLSRAECLLVWVGSVLHAISASLDRRQECGHLGGLELGWRGRLELHQLGGQPAQERWHGHGWWKLCHDKRLYGGRAVVFLVSYFLLVKMFLLDNLYYFADSLPLFYSHSHIAETPLCRGLVGFPLWLISRLLLQHDSTNLLCINKCSCNSHCWGLSEWPIVAVHLETLRGHVLQPGGPHAMDLR